MSNFIIDIINQNANLIEIESSYLDTVNNIEIQRYENFELQIINTEKILPTDFPDTYPMSKIVGDLSIYRISGINSYLDNYHFDCGTP